jgi:hypothetical protein
MAHVAGRSSSATLGLSATVVGQYAEIPPSANRTDATGRSVRRDGSSGRRTVSAGSTVDR